LVYHVRGKESKIAVVTWKHYFSGESSMADNNEQPPTGRQSNPGDASQDDPTAELKRNLEETRLPADLREQILAELPPPEEMERLYRELQEKGGLSSEEFLASLGLEGEPQP
jgi:hypothetical protein